MTTLIEGGTVVGFQNGGHVVLPRGQVAYSGNAITYVGRDHKGEADTRIDAHGKLVIPGFVNHHMAFGVHMQLFRLDAVRPNFFNSGIGLGVQPEKAYQRTGFAERQTGEPAPNMPWPRRCDPAPRPLSWYPIMVAIPTGGASAPMRSWSRRSLRLGCAPISPCPTCPAARRARPMAPWSGFPRDAQGWEGLEQAVEFARAFDGAGEGRIRTFLFPYQADNCTPDLLHASKEAAAELGCPLKIHVAQYLLEFHEILRRTAMTPIQYLYDVGFLGPEVSLTHAIFTTRHPWLGYPLDDDSDVGLIAASGASVAHCPVVFARSGVALHSFSHYVRSGIPVSLGTDTSPHDMVMEMRAAALLSKLADGDATSGLAREVFDAATLGGARALHARRHRPPGAWRQGGHRAGRSGEVPTSGRSRPTTPSRRWSIAPMAATWIRSSSMAITRVGTGPAAGRRPGAAASWR